MDAFCDEPSDTRVDVSPDTLTSAVGGTDHTNHAAYFSLNVICTGTIYIFLNLKFSFTL